MATLLASRATNEEIGSEKYGGAGSGSGGGRGGAGAGFEAFGDVEGKEALEVVGTGAGGEEVVELGPAGDFSGGVLEAAFDFGGGVLIAGEEAGAELVEGRGVEEDGDEAVGEVGVGGSAVQQSGAEGGGALDVDVEEDVVGLVEEGEEVALAGAVEVVVDAGVLEEFTGGEGGFELGGGEEVVVEAVALAGAGGAGGAGDEAAGAGSGGEELVAKGGFAGAGGAGEDEEEAGAVG